MARKLTANVVVLNEQQNPVILTAGSEVPAEYADQVGDHCFADQDEESSEAKPAARTRKSSTK